ncbi:MAG: hypothetical protein Q4F31_01505 [Eubacteriales bacterium]|nr:hypothetical protein [Eubacteriales bacterium]
MNTETDKFLTRDDTKIIKAIGVLLMILHHLWAFPENIPEDGLKYLFSVDGMPSVVYFGRFGKICESFFFFAGGYGTYIASKGKRYDFIGKVKNLYKAYWKVFLIFIPVGFLFFSVQPDYCTNTMICSRFRTFSLPEFAANFVGMRATFNLEWWFLRSYLVALVSFPIVRRVVENRHASVNIFLVIIGSILMTDVLPFLPQIRIFSRLEDNALFKTFACQESPYVACFWMGAVAAENALLDRLNADLKKHGLLNPVSDVLIWIAVVYFRQSLFGEKADIFYIPVLIVCSMDLVNRMKTLRKVFLSLGKESTNLWLIHTFFCYYFYPAVKVVFAPKWAIPCYMVLVLLSYAASWAITNLWKLLGLGCNFRKQLGR